MATKSRARKFRRALRNADDIVHLFTGKRSKDIAGTGLNLFGEAIRKKVENMFTGSSEPELPLDSPYTILGIHPEALDVVAKGAFRALAREYHPDTGTKPDPVKFQAASEAYDAIMKERLERKGQECH